MEFDVEATRIIKAIVLRGHFLENNPIQVWIEVVYNEFALMILKSKSNQLIRWNEQMEYDGRLLSKIQLLSHYQFRTWPTLS